MLLYGADEDVANWVSKELFGVSGQFKLSKAIGILRNNQIIAGVVYNNHHEKPNGFPLSIEMSIASIDKRWCNRHNLKALFDYPFTQLCLRRVQTQCSSTNEGVIMFNQRLGFKTEGYHPEAWPLGGDTISFGMLRHQCKWLED